MKFDLATLITVHVAISLIGIVTGFVVMFGMLIAKKLPGWTAIFLFMTVATSVSGFLFPFEKFLPSHAFGALTLLLLPFGIYGFYLRGLRGGWRITYLITAVIAQYLNVFVLIVQLFQKLPSLHAIAQTQSKPPFVISQSVTLVAFLVFGVIAERRFRFQEVWKVTEQSYIKNSNSVLQN